MGVPYHPMLSAPGTPHIDTKSFHGSMHIPAHPPHHQMVYQMRGGGGPHPRMVLGENGAPSHLPMRDPKSRQMSPLPPKDGANGGAYGMGGGGGGGGSKEKDDGGLACCSGHFVVIWIILGIITFGILLGIVLKFTIA